MVKHWVQSWWLIWIDALFPLVGWWIEGFEETPLTSGLFGDRWYTKLAQTYFYQKDIIEIWRLPKGLKLDSNR